MAIILDGAKRAAEIKKEIRQKVHKLLYRPGLAVIQVGEDPASQIYVHNKKRDCEECGIVCKDYQLSESVLEYDIVELVAELNTQKDIDGILVQLPLPHDLDPWPVLQAIASSKDVDGFTIYNAGRLAIGEPTIVPCTPTGILDLLQKYRIPVKGAHCVIVSRSNIVGKPLAHLLLAQGATVTICHSETGDLASHTRRADILISAAGVPGLITADMLTRCTAIVDVGITRGKDGKLRGDVCFEEVQEKVSFITPVPGGVGPMTRAILLRNVLQAAQRRQRGL